MSDQGGVNKVFLVGEVSSRPRWHKHELEVAMLSFNLTTCDSYLQKGELREHKEEHSLKLPENKVNSEIKPGQLLHIEGRIRTVSFTDEKFIKRYKTEIMVIKVELLR